MNPDLELNVYLCVVHVLLTLEILVCSHRSFDLAKCNAEIIKQDEITLHHNYLAPVSRVLPAWIVKLANRPSRVIHVDPHAVVVPGLAGAFL